MVTTTKDGFICIGAGTDGAWYSLKEELSPHEAERVIREIRRAIDSVRNKPKHARNLGDF